jgi:hypothetical protein
MFLLSFFSLSLLLFHNIFNNIFNMVSKLFNMASKPLSVASNLMFPGILSGDLTFLVVLTPPSGHPLKNSSTPSSQPHLAKFIPDSFLRGTDL